MPHNRPELRNRGRLWLRYGIMLAAFFLLCASGPAAAADRVSICYGSASSALLAIAKEQGFTAAERLDVELRPHTSGKNSIQAMLDNKCDLSTAAQTPVVHHSFKRNDFLILATLSMSDDFEKIVVRSDRGIRKAADLRGRSVALPQFTTQHYLLDTYLAANRLKPQDVKRLYLHHNEVLKAFQRGEADAMVHREPEVSKLVEQLGGKAQILPSSGLCVAAYLLVGRQEFVRRNPAVVTRLLKALIRAEEFARKEPAKAKAIAGRIYGGDSEEVARIWAAHNYRITLDQSLLFILENMARWENSLLPSSKQQQAPNYLKLIYFDGLKTVRPDSVTIIR